MRAVWQSIRRSQGKATAGKEPAITSIIRAMHQRFKLIIFDSDFTLKGSPKRFAICLRSGSPAHGIQKGVETTGRVESLSGRWECDTLEDARADLRFPNQLDFLTKRVVFDGGRFQQMLRRFLRWQLGGAHIGHDVAALVYFDNLSLFRYSPSPSTVCRQNTIVERSDWDTEMGRWIAEDAARSKTKELLNLSSEIVIPILLYSNTAKRRQRLDAFM